MRVKLSLAEYEEDILTNQAFIKQGIVLDKLLESVVLTKFDLNDLLIGDKNAILLATRILAFGSDYAFAFKGETVKVNLSELAAKQLDMSKYTKGVNEFDFLLPLTKKLITFKLVTGKDERNIEAEISAMKKINPGYSADITTRLSHAILAIDGNRDQKSIRDFVKAIPSRDSKALREYMDTLMPDIPMRTSVTLSSGEIVEDLDIPVTVDFFWPK